MFEKLIFSAHILMGNLNEDSDIDLAIVLNNLSNSFTMQIQLMGN